jgi:hypothetical protein
VQDISPPTIATRVRLALAPARHGQVVLCSRNADARPELEAVVKDAFRARHGATVGSFMPVLIGLRDEAGAVAGVAGYRPAVEEPLYLEQYLRHSVEETIAGRGHPGTTRADVAEIGNFAARDCATALALVGVLAEFLLDREHRWVVFTATRTVRGILRHLGITLAELARAEPSRLAGGGDDWGSYYSTDPRVMLGHMPSWRAIRPAFRSR